MKINVMVSESAAFTPAQEKKIVPGSQFTIYAAKKYWPAGRTLKPGAKVTQPIKVLQYVYQITSVETTAKGLIKAVHARIQKSTGTDSPIDRSAKLSATLFHKLLNAAKPTKESPVGTMCIRLSSAKSTAAGVASSDEAKLAAISEELKTLNERRKALEDQYIKLKKKLDPKAYRNVKDDSSLKRRANRKRA